MSSPSRLLCRSAVAAAAVLVPAAPATAATTTPEARPGPTVATPGGQHCATTALTLDQLRAGARSAIHCHDTFAGAMASIGVAVPVGAPLARQQEVALASGSVLAIHYEHASGAGSSFSVSGSTCDGGGISMSSSDPWNDRVSSTRHQLCTQVKHWTGPSSTGDVQLTQGASGSLHDMNATLNDDVTTIRYW